MSCNSKRETDFFSKKFGLGRKRSGTDERQEFLEMPFSIRYYSLGDTDQIECFLSFRLMSNAAPGIISGTALDYIEG